MSDEEMIEQTIKTRYVIQHRMQMINTKTNETYWTRWRDGIGFTKGNEGGEYEYTFTDLAKAKRHLTTARRRRKHAFVMEYKLVEQVSIWQTIA